MQKLTILFILFISMLMMSACGKNNTFKSSSFENQKPKLIIEKTLTPTLTENEHYQFTDTTKNEK